MSKFTKITFDKVLIGGCVLVILVIFPGIMLYWSSHPQAEQQVSQAEHSAVTAVDPAPAELPENAGAPPVSPGTRAANIVSTTVDGKPYTFDSQANHIKIVEFWATWCGPCHMSIPAIIDLDNSLRGSGVETVGVSMDTDTAAQVKPFAESMGMHYTVLVDPQKNPLAGEVYNASGLPSIYIIDGKGIIRWSFSGYWDGEEQYVRQVINEIQTGQPVDQS
jgi:thiol-disulfide isomerase/thioredoxin